MRTATANRKAIRFASLVTFVLSILSASAVHAQVTRLEIASREPFKGSQAVGEAGPYEIIRGKIHGEVDPADPRNRIIQDLELAPRNARGRVEYVATFALAKPVDPARVSGTLVYQVVNRGNGVPTASPEGHISLVSGWQGRHCADRVKPDYRRPHREESGWIGPHRVRSSLASTTWRPARTPSRFA